MKIIRFGLAQKLNRQDNEIYSLINDLFDSEQNFYCKIYDNYRDSYGVEDDTSSYTEILFDTRRVIRNLTTHYLHYGKGW